MASLAEDLTRGIERRIVEGELGPGACLGTKRELSSRLGVALGTLNEVIRLLQARGLIEARAGHHGGIFVAAGSRGPDDLATPPGLDVDGAPAADYLAVRRALEPLVFREAVLRHSQADAVALDDLIARMELEAGSPAVVARLEGRLHLELARLCRNVALKGLYLTFVDRSREAGEPAPDLAFNRALVEAVLSGDQSSLEQALDRRVPR